MTTPVNIILSAMNNQFTLSTSGSIPSITQMVTSDATIHLTYSVPATVLQETFFYRADQFITSDASFVYYYVDMSRWPGALNSLNPKNGTVMSSYVANDDVAKDFMRNLAEQLFGTYLGADLFSNETDVAVDINLNCSNIANEIMALLTSIDKTNGSLVGISTDLSGNRYMNDNRSSKNICREIFNQLISNAPTRFENIKNNWAYNAGGVDDGFYKMPVLPGDNISFQITIAPSANQMTAIPTGRTSLASRTYTVILHAL
jgi:hypothetical protein